MKNFAQEMATELLSPPETADNYSDSTLAGVCRTLRGSGSSVGASSISKHVLTQKYEPNNRIQVMMTSFERKGLVPTTNKER